MCPERRAHRRQCGVSNRGRLCIPRARSNRRPGPMSPHNAQRSTAPITSLLPSACGACATHACVRARPSHAKPGWLGACSIPRPRTTARAPPCAPAKPPAFVTAKGVFARGVQRQPGVGSAGQSLLGAPADALVPPLDTPRRATNDTPRRACARGRSRPLSRQWRSPSQCHGSGAGSWLRSCGRAALWPAPWVN